MTACIYYHPDGFSTVDRQVMGRRVVGKSFLKAFIQHHLSDQIWIQVEKVNHAKEFLQLSRQLGHKEKIKIIQRNTLANLNKLGCVYYSGPGLGEWARHRAIYGDSQWSLCGLTHTTSSQLAMESIADLLLAPVQPWDALICTSRAVHDNVSRVLEAQAEYLRYRFRAARIVQPQLPIIPLGVHSAEFSVSNAQKKKARTDLKIPENTLTILFVGRLSFHSKAHPFTMYLALEEAVRQTGKQVILFECGHYPNEETKRAFAKASCLACPSVEVRTLDGGDSELFQLGWKAADVFCSLSDNIQEAFGITPVEAMAAGLPVVVSDWNGYRDTVRHNVDGFLIPTTSVPAGYGRDLAELYALGLCRYDMYLGYTSSMVSVDFRKAANAFITLFSSEKLRNSMGLAGKRNVEQNYDWSVIIPRYEELWSELSAYRKKSNSSNPSSLLHPCATRLDPFYAFESYPTSSFQTKSKIQLFDRSFDASRERLTAILNLDMFAYVSKIMAPANQLESVLKILVVGPRSFEEISEDLQLDDFQSKKLFRSLVWLLKMGLVVQVREESAEY